MKLHKIGEFDVLTCPEKMDWDTAMTKPEEANSYGIGGYYDWVLPDAQTLRALVLLDLGGDWCWSSSPCASNLDVAWRVGFSNGYVYWGYQDALSLVRLVRASQCLDINIAGAKVSMQQAGIPT